MKIVINFLIINMLSSYTQNFEEPVYHIPKKEVNTFRLSCDQVVEKEELFKGDGDEAFDQYVYSDPTYIPIIGDNTKSYFKKLYSLPIPPEVKRKVEEDIIGSGRRIHTLQDDVLCSLIINAYNFLNVNVDIEKVMNMFNIDPRKSKVLHLLQKVSTKNTLASNQENAFVSIIIEPSKYINEVFESYLVKINSDFRDKEQVINNIKRLMLKLEEMYPPIIQKPPRECASVIIYLYLKGNLEGSSRQIFNKKIFSELPNVVSTKFDSCFIDLEKKFLELFKINPDFMSQCYGYLNNHG